MFMRRAAMTLPILVSGFARSSLYDPRCDNKKFQNKTIIITGGGGNFGTVGALHFAKEGANVVLFDNNPAALHRSVNTVKSKLGQNTPITGISCDICNEKDVEKAVIKATQAYGAIHLLWNNAGYQGQMKPLLEYDVSDFQTVMDVNVVGAFSVLKHVAKAMAATGGGVIVNTGSVAGMRGTPTMAAYVSSKAAIHGLTLTAAKDLAPHNIRVNTVVPALIGPDHGFMWVRQNELQAKSGSPYFASDPGVIARSKIQGVPLKRLGEVEEVVSAVSYLLSEESSYVTGTSLVVAGGMA